MVTFVGKGSQEDWQRDLDRKAGRERQPQSIASLLPLVLARYSLAAPALDQRPALAQSEPKPTPLARRG